jgi:acyl-CoA synthetase (AMP-forming)/AMP-acid ligase II
MLVPDLLRRAAADAPDRVAARVDGYGEMTYAEWEGRSNAVARGLLARGIEAGERVALVFDNRAWLDYAVAYFATLKAGAVAVPFSPKLTPPEAAGIVRHCGARIVVAQPEHAAWAEAAVMAAAAAGAATDAAEQPGGVVPVEAGIDGLARGQPVEQIQVDRSEDDLADIIYTSGTTGTPKGVASPHRNVAYEHSPGGGLFEGQVFLHAVPLSTFAGTYAMMVWPCASRMTNVVMTGFDPARFAALLEQHRVSVTYMVPAMARLIIDSGALGGRDLSSLRLVRFGAAPMPPGTLQSLAEALPGALLINVYGLTEAGPGGTMMTFDPDRPESLGRPVGATRIRVVGDAGQDCAPGETGEIWIGPPAGTGGRQYFRDPEATAATFHDEWVRTGDGGYIDADGYLYLVDRLKDVVIHGGSNVSSVEVENALMAHPAVREAAVFGLPDPVMGEEVAAAVVLRPGASASADELQAFCRERLAAYKVPGSVDLVSALPRNEIGKVLKRELRARAEKAQV